MKKPWNKKKSIAPYAIMKNEAELSAEVNLYGEIVQDRPKDFWTGKVDDGLYIVESEFLEELESLKMYSNVTFRINSIGGDAFAGVAIYNHIRQMEAETTTIVDGLAASAASIVFLAGDKRLVGTGSQIMIHGASVGLMGWYNAEDLKRLHKSVETTDRALREIYTQRTGLSSDTIARMVTNTTWMTSEEAVEKGFADATVEANAEFEDKDGALVVNGIPHRIAAAYRPQLEQDVNGVEPIDIENHSNTLKEVNEMTVEELKTQFPDLVSAISAEAVEKAHTGNEQIVKDAVEAERMRIREIEGIEDSIADKSLVEKAKYGENPMDAKTLAFEAMKAESAAGQTMLDALEDDAVASGVKDVAPAPIADQDTEVENGETAHFFSVLDKVLAGRKK